MRVLTAKAIGHRTRRLITRCNKATYAITSSYAEDAYDLRRPFTAEAVRHRVWEAWASETGGPLDTATIVTYIDARAVFARLNAVCPGEWSMIPVWTGGHLWCHMTIGGITRPDLGEGYRGKGLWSDAVKRAAVPFGVGESLYATPMLQVPRFTEDGEALMRECIEDRKPWLKLTALGQQHCHNEYRTWLLRKRTVDAFGWAIDHGDIADSQGDIEVTGPPMPAPPERALQRVDNTSDTMRPVSMAQTVAPAVERDPGEAAQAALDELMGGSEDKLWILRDACNKALIALGSTPAHRLSELEGAKDEHGLNALLARLSTIKGLSPDPGEPVQGQEGTE